MQEHIPVSLCAFRLLSLGTPGTVIDNSLPDLYDYVQFSGHGPGCYASRSGVCHAESEVQRLA